MIDLGEDQGGNLREDISIGLSIRRLEFMAQTTQCVGTPASGSFGDGRVEVDRRGRGIWQFGIPGHKQAVEAAGLEELLVHLVKEGIGSTRR